MLVPAIPEHTCCPQDCPGGVPPRTGDPTQAARRSWPEQRWESQGVLVPFEHEHYRR